jgi:hypothetical protein
MAAAELTRSAKRAYQQANPQPFPIWLVYDFEKLPVTKGDTGRMGHRVQLRHVS